MTVVNSAATAAAILKEVYSEFPNVANLIYKDNPTYALMTKAEEAGGALVAVPFRYANGAGTAQDFASAVAGASSVGVGRWAVTGKSVHTVAQLSLDLVAQSQTNEMAFVQEAKLIVDAKFQDHANTLSRILFNDGTGTIGKISSISVSGLIQLTNVSDVVNFEVDMTLQCSLTSGSAPTAALGYIIAVDRSAGTLQMSAVGIGGVAGLPASWHATNFPYICVKGTQNLYAPGILGFLPVTAPVAGVTFYGFDRSIDSDRCAGLRVDCAGKNIEEALIDSSVKLNVAGGRPDVVVLNPIDYGSLLKAISSKVWVDVEGPANVSFRMLQLMTPTGAVNVTPDRSCPVHTGLMLELKTWKAMSIGKQPHIENFDTNEWLRIAGADAAEIRLVTRLFAPACSEPGHNAVLLNLGQ